MAEVIGVAPENFLTLYQISLVRSLVIAVEAWRRLAAARRRRSGRPNVGYCDRRQCRRLRDRLFADPRARVIGAAHAGWKGALPACWKPRSRRWKSSAASRSDTVAAIGPLIRQPNYEVGAEFVARFTAADADNARFSSHRRATATPCSTSPASSGSGWSRRRADDRRPRSGHLADDRFFSYRRSVHRKEPDYGRHVHAIALEG